MRSVMLLSRLTAWLSASVKLAKKTVLSISVCWSEISSGTEAKMRKADSRWAALGDWLHSNNEFNKTSHLTIKTMRTMSLSLFCCSFSILTVSVEIRPCHFGDGVSHLMAGALVRLVGQRQQQQLLHLAASVLLDHVPQSSVGVRGRRVGLERKSPQQHTAVRPQLMVFA